MAINGGPTYQAITNYMVNYTAINGEHVHPTLKAPRKGTTKKRD